MRPWIRRAAQVRLVLLVVAFGFQLWNVSRQVPRLWEYILQPPALEASPGVAMLRAQLEVMRQYDQRLLATVYWALGVIAAIGAALLGFCWYANFRVYERDKAVMQQELRSSLKSSIQETRDALLTEVRTAAEVVGNKVAGDLSNKINKVASDLRSVAQSVRKIEYDRTIQEAHRWQGNVPSNAFGAYTQAAEIALGDPLIMELEFTDALDGMVKLMEGGLQPDSFRLGRLKPVLDRLPAEHADVARRIRALAGIPT